MYVAVVPPRVSIAGAGSADEDLDVGVGAVVGSDVIEVGNDRFPAAELGPVEGAGVFVVVAAAVVDDDDGSVDFGTPVEPFMVPGPRNDEPELLEGLRWGRSLDRGPNGGITDDEVNSGWPPVGRSWWWFDEAEPGAVEAEMGVFMLFGDIEGGRIGLCRGGDAG